MASTTEKFKTFSVFLKSMKLKEKYISYTDFSKLSQDDQAKNKKLVIVDDNYAICEFLEELTNKLDRLRLSLRNG